MMMAVTLMAALTFDAIKADFPVSEKQLRQWGSPVVADLDQDGWPDLLLNDHGYSVRIMWNQQGKYANPYDLIIGDMHGVATGDIDGDGRVEIVVSRGGGSGTNARNTKMFTVDKSRKITEFDSKAPPLATMRGRTVKLVDIDNDGDLDLFNFAFPDALKKGESENYLYENNQGQLLEKAKVPLARVDGQKTLLTDLNGDGQLDFLWYGHGAVRAFENQGNFNFVENTKQYWSKPIHHVTAIVEVDYDNDGDMDLVMSRGEEFTNKESFYDAETKLFGYYTKRGGFDFADLVGEDVIELINIQSQWPHKSLYLGESGYEYEYPGETHSGRNLRLVNSDALGFVDEISKKGTYLGFIGNGKWCVAGNIWAPSSMVIRGILQHDSAQTRAGLQNVLLENRGGRFVDVTQALGLTARQHSTSVAAADFDNDGRVDLVFRQRGRLIEPNMASVYMNTNAGFVATKTETLMTSELGAVGLSIETFDYDLDGLVDVLIGNERGRWHLFRNTSVGNRFIKVHLGRSARGGDPQNALVLVKACDHEQTQRVGATAAGHAQSANLSIHFGLGQCQQSVEVTVHWSDGESESSEFNHHSQAVKMGY